MLPIRARGTRLLSFLAGAAFLAACDSPVEPDASDGLDFDQVTALAPGGGGGGGGGAFIVTGERLLGVVYSDLAAGLTTFHGVDPVALCAGTPEFDVVEFRTIETPSEAGRFLVKFKGEELRTSVWPFSEWTCPRVNRTAPLATGTVSFTYTSSSSPKARAWGYSAHGTVDGRQYSGHNRCVRNGNKRDCQAQINVQGHRVAILNPANGNYYQGISTWQTWTEARGLAEELKYRGCRGHLATITSQEENDFVAANLPWATTLGYWLGGFQEADAGEPNDGWQWVTGESWDYTNWANGEPNDFGDEDALHYFGPFVNPGAPDPEKWNDAGIDGPTFGYLVEYECR